MDNVGVTINTEIVSRLQKVESLFCQDIQNRTGLKLAIGIDTSGAIPGVDIEMFERLLCEIQQVFHRDCASNFLMTIFQCDSMILSTYPFEGKIGKMFGRGGSDLEPVFKEVTGKYDALIYFTDFYAPEIKTRYNIPVLWILSDDAPRSSSTWPYRWGTRVLLSTCLGDESC